MQHVPQVLPQEAKNFAAKWTYKGLAIVMDDAHLQFATDFANVALSSFIQHCQMQALAAQAQMQAQQQAKVVKQETPKFILTDE